jgi:hypothetical protein
LGTPAEAFQALKKCSRYGEVNQEALNDIYDKRMFKYFTIELQAAYTSPSFDNKLNFVCNRIYKEDHWKSFNKALLDKLHSYRKLFE